MQQPHRTLSPSGPTARIDLSPKEQRNSPFSSAISQRSIGTGDDRFGESIESCNGSTLRQPIRSMSHSPETVVSTIKVINAGSIINATVKIYAGCDSQQNFSAMEHTSSMPTESWSNMITQQPSSDFNTSKSLDASVFSFAALQSTTQSMLSESDSEFVEEEKALDVSNDRFQSSLMSSERNDYGALKAPIRLKSENSLESLRSSDGHRETSPLPITIEVINTGSAMVEDSVTRTTIDLNSGSSHDRFFASTQSERSLTLKPPVRTKSTEKIAAFETVNKTTRTKSAELKGAPNRAESQSTSNAAEKSNKSTTADKYSHMIRNRFQVGVLQKTASKIMPIDNIGTYRTPKDAAILSNSGDINDASMSLESVFPDKLCDPTSLLSTQSSGASTVYQPAKSSLTSTLSNTSDNEHQLAAVNESLKGLKKGSDHSSRRQRKSIADSSEKRFSNPRRSSKEQVQSLQNSPVKKFDTNSSQKTNITDSFLSQTTSVKEASKVQDPQTTSVKEASKVQDREVSISHKIDHNNSCDTTDTQIGKSSKAMANESMQSEENRRRVRKVNKQSHDRQSFTKDSDLTDRKIVRPPVITEGSSKRFHRDGTKRSMKIREEKSNLSTVTGNASPTNASRTVTLDKASMLVPRNDSRIRHRPKHTINEKDVVATSISFQLSSPVMQRDESQKNVIRKRIEKSSSKDSNASANSPSQKLTLNRDESRRRVEKADPRKDIRVVHLNDSDITASTAAASLPPLPPTMRSSENRTMKKKPENHQIVDSVTADIPTNLIPSTRKDIQRTESRMRRKRATSVDEVVDSEMEVLKSRQVKSYSPTIKHRVVNDEEMHHTKKSESAGPKVKKINEIVAASVSIQSPSKSIKNEESRRRNTKQGDDSHIQKDLVINSANATKSAKTKAGRYLSSAIQRDESRIRTTKQEHDTHMREALLIGSANVRESTKTKAGQHLPTVIQRDESRMRTRRTEKMPSNSDVRDVKGRLESTSTATILLKKSNAGMHRDGEIVLQGTDERRRREFTSAISILSKDKNAATQREKSTNIATDIVTDPRKLLHRDGSYKRVTKPIKNALIGPVQYNDSDIMLISTPNVGTKATIAKSESNVQINISDVQLGHDQDAKIAHESLFSLADIDTNSAPQSISVEPDSVSRKDFDASNDLLFSPRDLTLGLLIPTPQEASAEQPSSGKPTRSQEISTSWDPFNVILSEVQARGTKVANSTSPQSKVQKTHQRAQSYNEQNEKNAQLLHRRTPHDRHTEKSGIELIGKPNVTKNCIDELKISNHVPKDNSSRRNARTSTTKASSESSPETRTRIAPANLNLTPREKATPSDQSDSSSDPSLPDRDIDFVRLRIIAASKRHLMSKSNTEELSARFNINSDKCRALSTVQRIDHIGTTLGVSAFSEIQVAMDDSKNSTVVAADDSKNSSRENASACTHVAMKTNQRGNNNEHENDSKIKSGIILNDNARLSIKSKVKSEENNLFGLLDNKLKTRHLRRLVEPNDEQTSRHSDSNTNGNSFCSSWSHHSSNSEIAATITSVGTDNDEAMNITGRRLSIRQQRLPRRHFSRRMVGSSSSILGENSNHAKVHHAKSIDKIDMMPQRPLRRLSQCSDDQPSSILSLPKQKSQPYAKDATSANSGGRMSSCEEGSESSNDKDTLNFETTEAANLVLLATNIGCGMNSNNTGNTNIEETNITLMTNDDGSIVDLFTQFSWSLLCSSTHCDNSEEYEQRHTLRSRIRNTPLHIAMERYYNECKV